ncbi:hypothetical protein EDB89DRAFT_1081035 [Lactarius sanguifluus]|nr:hypothetical protein EDB89DRAFT_1081035 [Lactarius sanguifluus]
MNFDSPELKSITPIPPPPASLTTRTANRLSLIRPPLSFPNIANKPSDNAATLAHQRDILNAAKNTAHLISAPALPRKRYLLSPGCPIFWPCRRLYFPLSAPRWWCYPRGLERLFPVVGNSWASMLNTPLLPCSRRRRPLTTASRPRRRQVDRLVRRCRQCLDGPDHFPLVLQGPRTWQQQRFHRRQQSRDQQRRSYLRDITRCSRRRSPLLGANSASLCSALVRVSARLVGCRAALVRMPARRLRAVRRTLAGCRAVTAQGTVVRRKMTKIPTRRC